jgi:hypothetical protein
LDYLVNPHQNIRWNRQTDLLSGLEVDSELKLRWPLVAGPFARPESLSLAGLVVGIAIGFVGLAGLFSRRHGGVYVNPFFAALIVLGVIALVGALIVLLDKGIKRRS